MDEPIVNFLERSTLNALFELLQKYGTCTDFTSGNLNKSNIKERIFVGSVSQICTPRYRKYKEQNKKSTHVLVVIAENLVGDKKQSKKPIRIGFIGNVVRELLNENIQVNDVIAILNPRVFHVNYSKSTLITLSVGPFNAVVWLCRILEVEKCNPTVTKNNTTVAVVDNNSDDLFADTWNVPDDQSNSSVSMTRPNKEGFKKTTTLAEEETIFEISDEHSESDLSVSIANNRCSTLPIVLEKVNGGISSTNLIHQTQNTSNTNSLEFQQIPNPTTTNNNIFSKTTKRTDVTMCENRNVVSERANFPEHSLISNKCFQHSYSNCLVQSGCCPSRQFRCRHENSCFHNFYHCAHCICKCGIQRCQFQCLYHSLKKRCSCVNSCKCGCSNMKFCCFNRGCSTKIYCCNYQKSLCPPKTSCHTVIHKCCGISKINCCRNKDEGNLQQSLNPDITYQMERITRTENWIEQCIPHSPYKQIVPIQVDSLSSSNASNSPYKQIVPIPVNSSSSSNVSNSLYKQIIPPEYDSSSSSNASNSSLQFQENISSCGKVASNQSSNKNVRYSVEPILPKKKIKLYNSLEYSGIIVEESDSTSSEHRDTPSRVIYCEALPRKATEVVREGPPGNSTDDVTETPQSHVTHISNEPIALDEQHKMHTGNVEGKSLMEQNKSRGSVCDLSQISTKSNITIDLEQEKSVKDNVNLSTDSLHGAYFTQTLSEKSRPSPSEQWTIRDVNEISAYATTAKKLSQQNVTLLQSHPLTFSLNQVIPVKALIINMIPDPENIGLLIKGMCNDRCRRSIYYSQFDEMERMDISTCTSCKYRIHYACPVCDKDGRKYPLCIFFSFELHLFINKQVLRVEVTHADAVNFLGCPPSAYLKAYKRFSKILKKIIYDPIREDSLTFLNAKIRPKKKIGGTILTLCNTTLTKNLEQNGSLFKFPIIK